jgi:hypothetical protein
VQNTTLFIDGVLTAVDSTTGSTGAIFTIDGLSGSDSYVVDYGVCTEFGCCRSALVTAAPRDDSGCANSTLVSSGSLCSAVLADLGARSTVAECSRAVSASNVCGAVFMWSYSTHQCECCNPLASPTFVPAVVGSVSSCTDAACTDSTVVSPESLCSSVVADLGARSTVVECASAVGASNACSAIFMWSHTTHQCQCCDPLASPAFVPAFSGSVYTSLVATTAPEPPDAPIVAVIGCDTITVTTKVPAAGLNGGSVQNMTLSVVDSNGVQVATITVTDVSLGSETSSVVSSLDPDMTYSMSVELCTEFRCALSPVTPITSSNDVGCADSTLVSSGSLCSAVLADLGARSTVTECSRAVGASNVCGAVFMWSYSTHQCECCNPLASPTFVPAVVGSVSSCTDAACTDSTVVSPESLCSSVVADLGARSTVVECASAVGASNACSAIFMWSHTTHQCQCCDPLASPAFVPAFSGSVYTSLVATTAPKPPDAPIVQANSFDTITVTTTVPTAGLNGGSVQNMTLSVVDSNGVQVATIALTDVSLGSETSSVVSGLDPDTIYNVSVELCTEFECAVSPVVTYVNTRIFVLQAR